LSEDSQAGQHVGIAANVGVRGGFLQYFFAAEKSIIKNLLKQ
jgi:hypothetical protein